VELVHLEANTGTIKTEVFGPYNKLFASPPVIKTPMTLTVVDGGQALRIEPSLGDGDAEAGNVGWVVFTFAFNPVVSHRDRPVPPRLDLSEIRLYLSPIHFNRGGSRRE